MIVPAFYEDQQIIIKHKDADKLHQKGWYGEKIGSILYLSNYEALHLLEKEKITVYHSITNEKLLNHVLVHLFEEQDSSFWTNYLVYKDLRNRGYFISNGESKDPFFFRLYGKGTNPKVTPYRYLVVPMREGLGFPLRKLDFLVSFSRKIRKELVVALVDSLGDVTYVRVDTLQVKDLKSINQFAEFKEFLAE